MRRDGALEVCESFFRIRVPPGLVLRREHDDARRVRVAEAQVDLRARPEAVQVISIIAGVVRVDVDRFRSWRRFGGRRRAGWCRVRRRLRWD